VHLCDWGHSCRLPEPAADARTGQAGMRVRITPHVKKFQPRSYGDRAGIMPRFDRIPDQWDSNTVLLLAQNARFVLRTQGATQEMTFPFQHDFSNT